MDDGLSRRLLGRQTRLGLGLPVAFALAGRLHLQGVHADGSSCSLKSETEQLYDMLKPGMSSPARMARDEVFLVSVFTRRHVINNPVYRFLAITKRFPDRGRVTSSPDQLTTKSRVLEVVSGSLGGAARTGFSRTLADKANPTISRLGHLGLMRHEESYNTWSWLYSEELQDTASWR